MIEMMHFYYNKPKIIMQVLKFADFMVQLGFMIVARKEGLAVIVESAVC